MGRHGQAEDEDGDRGVNQPTRLSTQRDVTRQASRPSLGGPELMLDDTDDNQKPRAFETSSAGPQYDMTEPNGSQNRKKSRNTETERAVMEGSTGPMGSTTTTCRSSSRNQSTVDEAIKRQAAGSATASDDTLLTLAPGVEGQQQVRSMGVSSDERMKRAAAASRPDADRPGAVAVSLSPSCGPDVGNFNTTRTNAADVAVGVLTSQGKPSSEVSYSNQVVASCHGNGSYPAEVSSGVQQLRGGPGALPVRGMGPSTYGTLRYVMGTGSENDSKQASEEMSPGLHQHPEVSGTENGCKTGETHPRSMVDLENPSVVASASMGAALPAIVAELAPNEDEVAERIAERVRIEMEEKYARRLEEQKRTVVGQPVTAVKIPINEEEEARPRGNDVSEQEDKSNKDASCFGLPLSIVILLVVLVVVLVVIGVLFGVGVVGGGDEDPSTQLGVTQTPSISPPIAIKSPAPSQTVTDFPTGAPTLKPESERFEQLFMFLSADISDDPGVLWDQTTAQYRALEWLANQDPSQLPVGEEAFRTTLIERYAVLVIAFQNGQAANLRSYGFFTARPVCSWSNELPDDEGGNNLYGIVCIGARVSELSLRESNMDKSQALE